MNEAGTDLHTLNLCIGFVTISDADLPYRRDGAFFFPRETETLAIR